MERPVDREGARRVGDPAPLGAALPNVRTLFRALTSSLDEAFMGAGLALAFGEGAFLRP